jgi:hypothetical protein
MKLWHKKRNNLQISSIIGRKLMEFIKKYPGKSYNHAKFDY